MNRFNHGFTMIELLLALMLSAMLTAALSMMIGQAARDREALRDPPASPAWASRCLTWIEHDLQHARGWARAQDRLVVIGLGRNGTPAKIEYRWSEIEQTTAWVRHELPLTTDSINSKSLSGQVIALNPAGISVGPHHFGKTESTSGTHTKSERADHHHADSNATAPGASVVVMGRRVPLRPIPGRLTLELAWKFNDAPPLRREVIIR